MLTVSIHEHLITDNRTPAQMRKAIAEKAEKLGIPVLDLKDITPKRATTNPDGAPKYKRELVPNRQLTDEEFEAIDWVRMEVNK